MAVVRRMFRTGLSRVLCTEEERLFAEGLFILRDLSLAWQMHLSWEPPDMFVVRHYVYYYAGWKGG
jgi:hypothetical protein